MSAEQTYEPEVTSVTSTIDHEIISTGFPRGGTS